MKVIIFDTETSGKIPQKNVILSLSYQVVDSNSWGVIKKQDFYFPWPNDESRVEMEAIDKNGLTKEFLSTKNLSNRRDAIAEFISIVLESELIVAHNLNFDKRFIIQTCIEYGIQSYEELWPSCYDTMLGMKKYCSVYDKLGRIKNPQLVELARYLNINISDIDFHKSGDDVELTKRCFCEIVNRGFFESSKHYEQPSSKNVSKRTSYKEPKINPDDKKQRRDLEDVPNNPFKNKVVVPSGFKDRKTSQLYGHILQRMGAKPKDNLVVKECGILLLGPGYTEKDKTAKDLGYDIISEEEFIEIIDQYCDIWMN